MPPFLQKPTPGCYVKARHVLALMLFWGTFNAYSLRVNLNVAIVAMVNSTNSKSNITNATTTCPDHGASNIHSIRTVNSYSVFATSVANVPLCMFYFYFFQNGVFQWDPNEQGLLLGCYYYGYIFTCLPGGYLTNRFGIKPILGLSMLLSSIITVVTPYLANVSFPLLVSSRILLGLIQVRSISVRIFCSLNAVRNPALYYQIWCHSFPYSSKGTLLITKTTPI